MKKLCLILLAVSAALVSFTATSFAAENRVPRGNDQTRIIVTANQQPVYVQNSFGTFGFSVTSVPYPVLNVSSSQASMTEVSLVCMGTGQYLTRSFPHIRPNNGTIPVFGTDWYEVTVTTNRGIFSLIIIINGLPDYEPGDPHIPMPIDDPTKI